MDLGIAGKVRPVVVVNGPLADDDYALLATVPHTTSDHPSQYALSLHVSGLKDGFFNLQGLAPVPRGKFLRRIGILGIEQQQALDQAIRRWLMLGSEG